MISLEKFLAHKLESLIPKFFGGNSEKGEKNSISRPQKKTKSRIQKHKPILKKKIVNLKFDHKSFSLKRKKFN